MTGGAGPVAQAASRSAPHKAIARPFILAKLGRHS
jgi:hypothetical protein